MIGKEAGVVEHRRHKNAHTPRILIVQNHPVEGLDSIEAYLGEHKIAYTVYPAYRNEGSPPIQDYDAFIVGGTPTSLYDPDRPEFFRRETALLARAVKVAKPCLGVCGGGQLLANILGAEVRKNPVREIGIYKVTLTTAGRRSRFFEGFPSEFPVFQWHGDTFDTPKGCRLLVQGRDCANQAFSYGNSLALQFHLEVSSRTAAKWADEYQEELEAFGKTKEEIVEKCKETEAKMRLLSDRLVANFLNGLQSLEE